MAEIFTPWDGNESYFQRILENSVKKDPGNFAVQYKRYLLKTVLTVFPASSSGTRLHRGYVEDASPEDRFPQTTHVVFVVHGIGQKMDQGRIIKNTGM